MKEAMNNTWLRAVVHFFSWGVAGYALVAYALLPLGAAVHPEMRETFLAQRGAVYLHAFAASVALLLGPLQFWPALRARRPQLHRHLGRMYLAVGVGLGGLSGLWLAQHAFGGPVARVGFTMLALLWMASGCMALARILGGDVPAHRRWMLRNFTLTLAAVTLRLEMPLAMVAGLPLEASYAAIAWLCWLPQWLGLEVWLARGRSARLVLTHPQT
jgi:uncharacterized membrane protein